MLRELGFCRLDGGPTTYVHVGYDFYLYLGGIVECGRTLDLARDVGLFVDQDFVSPYTSILRLASTSRRRRYRFEARAIARPVSRRLPRVAHSDSERATRRDDRMQAEGGVLARLV